MADQNKTEEEPSIEEILASIRQIISDDDEEPDAEAVVEESSPEPESEPEPEEDIVSFPEEDDDILDLTQSVEEPKPAIEVDLMDQELEPEPEPEPMPPPPAPKAKEPDAMLPPMEDFAEDALFTRNVESSAYAAISELASKAAIERMSGITIEDVVRDELRPMLREWLDRHLPPLIERLVQDELERVSKRVLGDLGE